MLWYVSTLQLLTKNFRATKSWFIKGRPQINFRKQVNILNCYFPPLTFNPQNSVARWHKYLSGSSPVTLFSIKHIILLKPPMQMESKLLKSYRNLSMLLPCSSPVPLKSCIQLYMLKHMSAHCFHTQDPTHWWHICSQNCSQKIWRFHDMEWVCLGVETRVRTFNSALRSVWSLLCDSVFVLIRPGLTFQYLNV